MTSPCQQQVELMWCIAWNCNALRKIKCIASSRSVMRYAILKCQVAVDYFSCHGNLLWRKKIRIERYCYALTKV